MKLRMTLERYIEKVFDRFNMNKVFAIHLKLNMNQSPSTNIENEGIEKVSYP